MDKEKRNKNDELDKLLTEMRGDNSMPTSNFEQELKSKLLGKTKRQSFFDTAINLLNFRMKPALFIISVLVLFVAILGVGSSYLYLSAPKKQEDKEILSDVQKTEFLSNVIGNNPQGLLNTDLIATAELISKPNLVSNIRSEKLVAEAANKTYTFSHSTNKFAIGPAQSKCNIYGDIESSTNNYYEYVNGEGFYTKSIESNGNDELLNYYLFTGDEYIYFLGGKYAVKHKLGNNPSDETPVDGGGLTDEKTGDDDLVKTYFGSEAKVEKIENNTYLLTYESKISCNEKGTPVTPNAESENSKLIYRYHIDGSNYTVFKSEEYLESISEENLLSSFETETEKSMKTFDEVANIFNFEYEVEVKDGGEYIKTYGELHEDTMNYLKENSTKLLTFSDESIGLSKIDVPALYQTNHVLSYFLDRDFYPEGERGDKIYENSSEIYGERGETVLPELYILHADKEESYYLSYYGNMYSGQDILEENTANALSLIGTELKIQINGEEVVATGYTETEACDNGPDCQISRLYHYMIFEFDGHKVLLSLYTTKPLSDFADKFVFSTLDMSRNKDFETVDTILRGSIEEIKDNSIPLGNQSREMDQPGSPS